MDALLKVLNIPDPLMALCCCVPQDLVGMTSQIGIFNAICAEIERASLGALVCVAEVRSNTSLSSLHTCCSLFSLFCQTSCVWSIKSLYTP